MAGENQDDADSSLSSQAISLIFDKRYEEARTLIELEQGRLLEGEPYRLLTLSDELHRALERFDKDIASIRRVMAHLYMLSVLLMDSDFWSDADRILQRVIALSLENDETFFLSECRFRRAICLRALGHVEEFRRVKAEVPVGTSILLDDGSHRIEDL